MVDADQMDLDVSGGGVLSHGNGCRCADCGGCLLGSLGIVPGKWANQGRVNQGNVNHGIANKGNANRGITNLGKMGTKACEPG